MKTTNNMNKNTNRTRKNNSNKKYRVKSPVRFIAFIVVVMCLSIGAFGVLTGFNTSTALAKAESIEVHICAGDTLWDIANEYKDESTDTRRAVYEICKANDIQAGDIQPGMVISIPDEL